MQSLAQTCAYNSCIIRVTTPTHAPPSVGAERYIPLFPYAHECSQPHRPRPLSKCCTPCHLQQIKKPYITLTRTIIRILPEDVTEDNSYCRLTE